jgi:hydrogenase maturation protease
LKERSGNKKALVLGLGNPLSGDDGFGALVLEFLSQHARDLEPDCTLIDAHTDLLNHIEDFLEYDRVILIDTVLDLEGKLGKPGRILVRGEEAFRCWPEESHGAHQMSPLLAVKLFRSLHPDAQTRITLVGLLVDQVAHEPRYATGSRIEEAAAAVQSLLC